MLLPDAGAVSGVRADEGQADQREAGDGQGLGGKGFLGRVVDVVQALPAGASGVGVDEPEAAAALGGDADGAQEVRAGEVHGAVHDPLAVIR
ncbi:hypothetical protein O1Q96_04670 [Streptomyces sp. Qhu-G9]|uniref:hypothetical protein n=1 Tax=Streptomyces sp. Qhu-G9 TaxID=3452799 RepID=UPI0022AC6F03|nr:hypothetical protein [Streptomyces aurantiacus]WAU79109.1 hypothetical protein O1Q96_04670 [Streptomyces aurantiacus]